MILDDRLESKTVLLLVISSLYISLWQLALDGPTREVSYPAPPLMPAATTIARQGEESKKAGRSIIKSVNEKETTWKSAIAGSPSISNEADCVAHSLIDRPGAFIIKPRS